ncbi:photosystem reaction center subunit H [Paractinoplanes abujensis]|uniref:Uncharacterized protein (TIGR02271 family) n=1 Tax=Paractinoplanes abujensis TaxID=882441 RepID=A0A7W7G2F5_9ACTN|nr:PRC and DUF2382 domain-containing protein [Actinoplanes abujensis]MBB4693130.1 uncharacterized protein (TIGR02271 family) [Actinoplanes abujensis]GID24964.1 photosystem reaction center subunit H [Actinoplanes abujensis]
MIDRESVRDVYGTDVYSTDGDKIGSAGQVYLDNGTGDPAWVAVRTGLFGRKESFVPVRDATLDGGRLDVPFSKDRVQHAPRLDHDRDLSPQDEDDLYRYYEAGPDRDGRADRDEAAGTGHSGDAQTRPEKQDDMQIRSEKQDDAMIRSEERLVPHTRTEPTGRARLRKYTVTEEQQVTVPVTREEVRLEQEPAPDTADASPRPVEHNDDRGDDDGPAMTLWAERPVVTTEAVPVERVRLGKRTVTGSETVTGEVRHEQVELETGPGDEQRSR